MDGLDISGIAFSINFLSQSNQRISINMFISVSVNRFFISLAGFPPTIVYGGTSLLTTDPAATIAPSPIVTPGIIIAFIPIQASL